MIQINRHAAVDPPRDRHKSVKEKGEAPVEAVRTTEPTDSVEGAIAKAALAEPVTAPLALPAMPPLAGDPQQRAALVAVVMDTLARLVAPAISPQMLGDIVARAQVLEAHPQLSQMQESLPPRFVQNLLAEVRVAPSQAHVFHFFAALLSTPPTPSKPLAGHLDQTRLNSAWNHVAAFAVSAFAEIKAEARITEKTLHVLRELSPQPNPASQALLAQTLRTSQPAVRAVQRAMCLGEAGYEFLLGEMAKLGADDNQQQLRVLQGMLEFLRGQKEHLIKQLRDRASELKGKELMGAVYAQRADAQRRASEGCAIIHACIGVLIVLAVAALAVLTAVSGGGALLAVMAVAACLSAAATIAQNLPQLLRAIGMEDEATALEAWEAQNDWFATTIIVVQLVAAATSLCCGGYAAWNGLPAIGGSLKWINLGIQVIAGLLQAGMAISQNGIQKGLIEAQTVVEQLKYQAAQVDIAIKELLNEIEKIKVSEDGLTDSLRDEDERKRQLDERIEKMFQSCSSMAHALIDMFNR